MSDPVSSRKQWLKRGLLFLTIGLTTFGVAALLMNIFERKQEAKNPYLKLVEVTEETTDPEKWGMNFPSQYDGYKRTAQSAKTRFGGSDSFPAEKADSEPWNAGSRERCTAFTNISSITFLK